MQLTSERRESQEIWGIFQTWSTKTSEFSSWQMAMSRDVMRFHEVLGGLHFGAIVFHHLPPPKRRNGRGDQVDVDGVKKCIQKCYHAALFSLKVLGFADAVWCVLCLLIHIGTETDTFAQTANKKTRNRKSRIWTAAAEWAQPLGGSCWQFFFDCRWRCHRRSSQCRGCCGSYWLQWPGRWVDDGTPKILITLHWRLLKKK